MCSHQLKILKPNGQSLKQCPTVKLNPKNLTNPNLHVKVRKNVANLITKDTTGKAVFILTSINAE
jgi:hypothetical protein